MKTLFRSGILFCILINANANHHICGHQYTELSGLDPVTCCPIPDVLDDAITEKCIEKLLFVSNEDHKDNSPVMPSIACITECVFNDISILTNNTLDTTIAYDTFIQIVRNDSDWEPVIKSGLEQCKLKAKTENFVKDNKNNQCSQLAGFLFKCLNTELFMNCPVPKWTESPNCSKLKEFAKICPILPGILKID